jgi:hypothetical protein
MGALARYYHPDMFRARAGRPLPRKARTADRRTRLPVRAPSAGENREFTTAIIVEPFDPPFAGI